MTAEVQTTSWWSDSSWFTGGLQQAAVDHCATAPQQAAPTSQPAEPDGLTVVGGAKAQSRFSGKTAIPIATCSAQGMPMSTGAGTAAATARATEAPAGAAVPKQPQLRQHAAWGGARAAGHTVDGSVPAGGTAMGEHTSRWVFDTANWRWALKGQQVPQQPGATSDKHLLAARRWGDSRDALGATAAQRQQQQRGHSDAPSVPTPAAAPVKRPRLHISAMTGSTSDGGWAAVGGLQKQKDALMEQVVLPLAHPRFFSRLGVSPARGVLLHGPPGSGKTHLARALAAQARLPIVVLSGGECVGEQAEKKLHSAFNQAKSQAPCILLLDELDALAPARATSTSEHERQATARLLPAVDELRASRARVGLVGATNRREAVEPALRRAGRLDGEVALGALREDERADVLRCCTQRMPLDACVSLPHLAAQLRGYVAADAAAVCSEAALVCAVEAVRGAEAAGCAAGVEAPDFLSSLRVTDAHFEVAAARLGPAVLRGLAPEVPEVSWDAIGGLAEAKEALRDLVDFPLAHGDLLAAYGLPPPRGALLYGPPGCGKTLLAKAAAAQCRANFLSVRGPELLQKWLGESEAAVRRVFETARQAAPCLIFFDELDSIGGRRSGGGGGDATAARVLNQLLTEMDGMTDRGGVFVLAATNRPECLDPALTRPGRLDHLLRVPLPDTPARASILASALRRCPLAADVDLAALAAASEGMSGADLAEAARRAGMAAIRQLVAAEAAAAVLLVSTQPLQQHHLEAALAGMRRSVSAAESERHVAIEHSLRDGSLAAPGEQRQPGDSQLAALVRQAATGPVHKLQQRVQLLEAALRSAGLAVPEEQ